ncbi:MAG TPA: vanadium-dependent haloperoxidase [Burkholderiaceae bacterium]|nr:vanadium-dependent haloperoxidase [Burkholderiaceae bacterium]
MKTAPALMALALCGGSGHADTISDWNGKLIGVMLAEQSNPLVQSRNAALVHVAMFEAVNSIERRYAPYRQAIDGKQGASAAAAAAVAAHRSLLALYPKQKPAIDEALALSLDGIEAEAMAAGATIGEKAAAQMLQLRTADGTQDTTPYIAQTARGAWVPNPGMPALGVRWGSVTPWVLKSGSLFRPGPPPDLASEQFKRDYLEAKELGAKASTRRTAAQTQIARFWITSGPVLWSQAAAQLAAARKLSLVDSARTFALLHMAGADALTACWDAKYTYHNFRPITAIRAGLDGLPADAAWEPAIPTPPFPAYVSGHACYSGAAAAVLGALFGAGDITPVTIKSPTAPGLERSHTRLADIAAEVNDARVWGGIHWRTDQTEGEALGRKVGAYVLANAPMGHGAETR